MKRDSSASAMNPVLKVSSRVKYGCCYRFTSGPRQGRMCGDEVSKISPSDYCPEHALKVLEAARSTPKSSVPYPDFCLHPDKCKGRPHCPRRPACID